MRDALVRRPCSNTLGVRWRDDNGGVRQRTAAAAHDWAERPPPWCSTNRLLPGRASPASYTRKTDCESGMTTSRQRSKNRDHCSGCKSRVSLGGAAARRSRFRRTCTWSPRCVGQTGTSARGVQVGRRLPGFDGRQGRQAQDGAHGRRLQGASVVVVRSERREGTAGQAVRARCCCAGAGRRPWEQAAAAAAAAAAVVVIARR